LTDRIGLTPAHSKVSLSRPTATGGDEMYPQNYSSEGITLMQPNKTVCQNRLAMWPASKG